MKSFEELFEELARKLEANPKNSNTLSLLKKGTHSIGKKIVEEAAEVWMSAEYESKEQLAKEISQLIYYVQVLMIDKSLSLKDIYKFL